MTVQLNFYDKSDDLYLVYTFENERPSNACYVSARRQGVPSKHSLTVTVDGKEVIVKKRGFKRLNEFYEARDVQFDGTAAVYIPIRVVVHKAV
jgi:hypothetical protein